MDVIQRIIQRQENNVAKCRRKIIVYLKDSADKPFVKLDDDGDVELSVCLEANCSTVKQN